MTRDTLEHLICLFVLYRKYNSKHVSATCHYVNSVAVATTREHISVVVHEKL